MTRNLVIAIIFLMLGSCTTNRHYYLFVNQNGDNNKVTVEVTADVPKTTSVSTDIAADAGMIP